MDYLVGFEDTKEDKKQQSFHKFINSNKQSLNSSTISPLPIEEHRLISKQSSICEAINHINKNFATAETKPKIDRVSEILSEKRGARVHNIWEGLYQLREIDEKNQLNNKLKQLENEDVKYKLECTFTPKIKKLKEIENGGNIFERTNAWKQKVQEKIDNEIEKKKHSELNDCIFMPSLEAKEKVKEPQNIYNRGVETHYKRINEAKIANEMKNQRLYKCTGSNWKRHVTIPEKFNLSSSPHKYAIKKKVSNSPKREMSLVDEFSIGSTLPLEVAQSELHKKLLSIDIN